jgi:methyltransferase (TIGR00027 family)
MSSVAASSLDALALSAWWTAAARAQETRRSDRLFEDPWATILAGERSVDDFDCAIKHTGSGTADLHAITTRFFDDFLLRVTGVCGIRQVVLVAAGLDARAFRLTWPPQTRLFELDQPHVIAYKDGRFSLISAVPRCARHTVGVNLKEPWTDLLCRLGFDPDQRSVWLLEGFIYFLSETAVRNLFAAITTLAAPGSYLGVDLINGDMLTSPSTRHWNERMSAVGAPWLFTSDEPEAFLAEFGWSAIVVEPGENGADFGRSPYPVAPRTRFGIPRSFLVTTRPRL